MEKKRSVGVIVISILEVVVGVMGLYPIWNRFLSFEFNIAGLVYDIRYLGLLFMIILGIGTFQLKPVSRKLQIVLSPLTSIFIYLLLIGIAPSQKIADIIIFWGIKDIPFRFIVMGLQIILIAVILIYFFTRPEVKKQFK
ncbi:MAG: hypothetical protein ISS26_03485 [Candidatus Omnitrophica bacterium]|nr:hypothetical protein [Candidatus Omnitrophota bacterium]